MMAGYVMLLNPPQIDCLDLLCAIHRNYPGVRIYKTRTLPAPNTKHNTGPR